MNESVCFPITLPRECIIKFLDFCLSDEWKKFFSSYVWGWIFLHMFKVHLYFLFCEFYDHILCPFWTQYFVQITVLFILCIYAHTYIYIHKPMFFSIVCLYMGYLLFHQWYDCHYFFLLCHFIVCWGFVSLYLWCFLLCRILWFLCIQIYPFFLIALDFES